MQSGGQSTLGWIVQISQGRTECPLEQLGSSDDADAWFEQEALATGNELRVKDPAQRLRTLTGEERCPLNRNPPYQEDGITWTSTLWGEQVILA